MSTRLSKGIFFLFLFLAIIPVFGQSANTSLRGTVKDPTGAVIPGAKINLVDNGTGLTFSAESNAAGEYQFAQIPPAKYTITITATGFGAQTKMAELLVNQPATIDFALTVTTTEEVLDVTAEAQTLNTTDASLGNSTNNATIQALPSETRNVPDLLSLQPGVLYLPPPSNPARTAAAARSTAAAPTRATSPSTASTTTTRSVDSPSTAYCARPRTRSKSSASPPATPTPTPAALPARRSAWSPSRAPTSSTVQSTSTTAPPFTVANDWFNKQAQLNSGQPKSSRQADPQHLRRRRRRSDHEGQALLLRQLRGHPPGRKRQQVTQVPDRRLPELASFTTRTRTATRWSLSPAQVAPSMLAVQICNTAAYTPGPGPNPNAFAYFKSMPAANGSTLGRWPQYRLLLLLVAHSEHSQHQYRAPRLHPICQAPHLRSRQSAEGDTVDYAEQFPGQGPSHVLDRQQQGHDLRRYLDDLVQIPGQRHSLRLYSARDSAIRRRLRGIMSIFAFLTPRPRKPAPPSSVFPSITSSTISAGVKGNHTIQSRRQLAPHSSESLLRFQLLQWRDHQSLLAQRESSGSQRISVCLS